MNIRTIWSSKFRSDVDHDFFNEIELNRLDGAIGLELLTDQESLAQWRQKMDAINNSTGSHAQL